MAKRSLKRSLNAIKEAVGLGDSFDGKLVDAFHLIEKKINELPEDAPVSALDEGSFPLPKELMELSEGYALFCDGACRGNPGPGAWGVLGQDVSGNVMFEASGVDVPTTNNKMELSGAIEALRNLENHLEQVPSSPVYLFSDSKYVLDGIKDWTPNWKKRGWKKADNKPPENLELWQQLDAIVLRYPNLHLVWVKGHSGHPQNEHVDRLANRALDEAGL